MFDKLTRSERVYLIMYLVNAEVDVWNVYHDGTIWWYPNQCNDSARYLRNEIAQLTEEANFGMGIDE
jgi:hypothetical protein